MDILAKGSGEYQVFLSLDLNKLELKNFISYFEVHHLRNGCPNSTHYCLDSFS